MQRLLIPVAMTVVLFLLPEGARAESEQRSPGHARFIDRHAPFARVCGETFVDGHRSGFAKIMLR